MYDIDRIINLFCLGPVCAKPRWDMHVQNGTTTDTSGKVFRYGAREPLDTQQHEQQP